MFIKAYCLENLPKAILATFFTFSKSANIDQYLEQQVLRKYFYRDYDSRPLDHELTRLTTRPPPRPILRRLMK